MIEIRKKFGKNKVNFFCNNPEEYNFLFFLFLRSFEYCVFFLLKKKKGICFGEYHPWDADSFSRSVSAVGIVRICIALMFWDKLRTANWKLCRCLCRILNISQDRPSLTNLLVHTYIFLTTKRYIGLYICIATDIHTICVTIWQWDMNHSTCSTIVIINVYMWNSIRGENIFHLFSPLCFFFSPLVLSPQKPHFNVIF